MDMTRYGTTVRLNAAYTYRFNWSPRALYNVTEEKITCAIDTIILTALYDDDSDISLVRYRVLGTDVDVLFNDSFIG